MTYIYALEDPNTNEVRYIGKSDAPKSRCANHLAMSKADVNIHKKRWIAKLKRNGQKPNLIILERVPEREWQDRERWWIQHGRDSSWPLTNIASGGDYNMAGATDSIFELIDILRCYVDDETAARLPDLPHSVLFGVAYRAAVDGARNGVGYFNGRSDGRKIYELMRRVISSDLSAMFP